MLSAEQAHTPATLTREQLLAVHTEAYLDTLSSSITCARVVGLLPVALVPNFLLRRHVLDPMLLGERRTTLSASCLRSLSY